MNEEQDGPRVLIELGNVTVHLASDEALEQFTFQDRNGMWIERNFVDMFGNRVIPYGAQVELKKCQLEHSSPEREIALEMNGARFFRGEAGKEMIKRIIASCLLSQWDGEAGIFLSNGSANLLYYEHDDGRCVVVRIIRLPLAREWDVTAWKPGRDVWRAGDVVFTPVSDEQGRA
ncbi:MAG: hypothetical protein NUW00_01540 [Candidatus Kaiserbacteria bacterium]|nr:hypothetical protein [Candidatus Kaiserbacteria bacterium]